uniref:Ig-like domain-containing protein n=1 Tax=Junco hyemalis TaxID=40217 RepID=A0A8C5IQD9_JUNHY
MIHILHYNYTKKNRRKKKNDNKGGLSDSVQESAPTISIIQKPPGVIPPGGSTTIYCICQCSSGSFRMYKGGHQLPTLEQSGGKAEFSISNATYEDRGSYVCHYLEGDTELARSTELEVFVEGEGCAVSPLVGSHTPGHSRMTCLGCPLALCVPLDPLLPPWEDWGVAVRSWAVTVPSVPADYTLCNAVRLALAAALLLLLGLIAAEAARGRCRGWGSRPRPPGPAALIALRTPRRDQ